MKKALIITGSLILAIVVGIIVFMYNMPGYGPTYVTKQVEFDNKSNLYLKLKNWGITANHQIIQLSTNASNGVDSVHNYVFTGADFLFYRSAHDTLFLYVYSKAVIPASFNSPIKVIQTELPNPKMMELFAKDAYLLKGLHKF